MDQEEQLTSKLMHEPRSPRDIANDPGISRDRKVRQLRRLEHDCRQILLAGDEGMTGQESGPSLGEVLSALLALGERPATARAAAPR